jgi:universal stress protein A
MTFKHILVPVDFSPTSAAALDCAREIARSAGGTITLFHVVDEVAARVDVPYAQLDEIQLSIEENAWRELDGLAQSLGTKAPRVTTAVRISTSPATAIVDYARAENIDIIVMGTHGRGPVVRLFLGAVADRVIRTAPCPVLTVRETRPVTPVVEYHAYAATPMGM